MENTSVTQIRCAECGGKLFFLYATIRGGVSSIVCKQCGLRSDEPNEGSE